jgi:hypothetical protein
LTEKQFFWEKEGDVSGPWMGILHVAKDLPPHLEHYLYLENVLNDEAFLGSLPHCLGLVVFSDEMRRSVSKVLADRGFTDVNVCAIHHPLTADGNKEGFTVTEDLEIMLDPKASVLLIGQEYRRLATIHQLATTRPKLWLLGAPLGSEDTSLLKERLSRQRKVDTVTVADPAVKLVYAADYQDFNVLLKQNIVIIDLWGASANNAILQAIALNIPVFVRRLPSTVEYLGSSYPMYFNYVGELEDSINENSIHLRKLLLTTHLFLRDMNKTHLSLGSFRRGLEECVHSGFKILPTLRATGNGLPITSRT